MAAREIPEIHNLGGGMARAFGAVRERVPGGGSDITRGVSVEVGERQAAVDLDVVVEYGASIADTAGDVRANVISAVERMAGLEGEHRAGRLRHHGEREGIKRADYTHGFVGHRFT